MYNSNLIKLVAAFIFLLFGCCSCKDISLYNNKRVHEIMVFAAASLTESFTELARDYENQKNNKIKVIFNFAGSNSLKTSVKSGAKADIFASASMECIKELKNEGIVKDYKIFAKNRLAIIKNAGSKFVIEQFKDLGRQGLRIAIGEEGTAAGLYWQKAIEGAVAEGVLTLDDSKKIQDNIKTKEFDVKHIVSKVSFGEADVGIVYKTDYVAAGTNKIQIIDGIFESIEIQYPIAILSGSAEKKEVKEFYEYVLSERGQKIFQKYGFLIE